MMRRRTSRRKRSRRGRHFLQSGPHAQGQDSGPQLHAKEELAFYNTGDGTQGLVHAKRVFYC